jgi:hypothetical protein
MSEPYWQLENDEPPWSDWWIWHYHESGRRPIWWTKDLKCPDCDERPPRHLMVALKLMRWGDGRKETDEL